MKASRSFAIPKLDLIDADLVVLACRSGLRARSFWSKWRESNGDARILGAGAVAG